MLFRWLEPAIRKVEGGEVDTETFESAYFEKYEATLRKAEGQLGMSAEKQATAFGVYQILGENLARYHGLRAGDLPRFLSDYGFQYRVARKQFYLMLSQLVKRRGLAWPKYLFSMWNGGINYVDNYARAIASALKR